MTTDTDRCAAMAVMNYNGPYEAIEEHDHGDGAGAGDGVERRRRRAEVAVAAIHEEAARLKRRELEEAFERLEARGDLGDAERDALELPEVADGE